MEPFEEITIDELKNTPDIDCNVDWVICEIGMFFRDHDKDKAYFVKQNKSDENVDSESDMTGSVKVDEDPVVVSSGLESDYAKYGIYFEGTKIINKYKTYLYLVYTEELLTNEDILEEIRKKSETNSVEIIVADIQSASIDTLMKIYEMLNNIDCELLNRININSIYSENDSNIEFLDLSEFGSLADNSETNDRLNALQRQIEYLKNADKSKRYALSIDDNENKMKVDVFDGLAATFMPRGYKFYTNPYKNTTYFESMVKMYSRRYMKITDYFDSILNHLNFGVYVALDVDEQASAKCKRCDLFLIQMENNQVPIANVILMPIRNGKLQRQTKTIDIPLNEVEYEEIDPVLLPYADNYLTECNIIQNESLHCSNTFCLKMQDQKFLAVFLKFSSTLKCKVSPFNKSIRWANVEISYEKYANILPITIFEDGMDYVRKIYKDNIDNIVLNKPFVDYMDYFAIAEMQFKTGKMDETKCIVPKEAIGMYFILSNAIRTKDCTALFSKLNKDALWNMGFLSYYGGPLPKLQIDYEFEYGDMK